MQIYFLFFYKSAVTNVFPVMSLSLTTLKIEGKKSAQT